MNLCATSCGTTPRACSTCSPSTDTEATAQRQSVRRSPESVGLGHTRSMGIPTRVDVEQWTPAERAQLARLLDEFVPRPFPRSHPPRRRVVVIAATCAGAVLLLPWIGYLSVSLPRSHSVRAWDVLWVGFDVVLACCLALTGWLVVQRRQLATFGLVVGATLLVCYAWFDVCLSWNSSEQGWPLATAGLVELPAAVLFVTSAVRILQRTSAITQQLRGRGGAPVGLWRQRFVMLPPDES